MRSPRLLSVCLGILLTGAPAFASSASRAHTPPRKVVVATTLADFTGNLDARLQLASRLIDEAAASPAAKSAGHLDLMVFPEFALASGDGASAAQAVSLAGEVLDTLGAKAREHHTWIVAPMVLKEADRTSNAAVLVDRLGGVAGIFRKNHPIPDDKDVFEGGVTPGNGFPVFETDFGQLGILICWDMAYEDSWDRLGDAGAEIVALPSASPQTIRPSAEALRHHYYVVTSTPKNNATVFDPIGRPIAQVTDRPGVVVQQIDLAYAILHWSEGLHNGQALTQRYGDKVGYLYSDREDTGVFWSNDPRTSIGEMIRSLGLREMAEQVDSIDRAVRASRPASGK
ncbi:MAG TPA: carbon-nitrogen hydrolase family protein [Lacunisphaera sp.]|jgi:predicted amidohydrolase|nr:carbon-nitrogen hydrolase family protein [Lacunisphaera sp.]